MGITNLIPLLRPYATSEALDGKNLVIDGPALAYYIWWRCSKTHIALPSYSDLATCLIGFLNVLARHDISIKAIYFDGFLPPAKWTTRQMRVLSSTAQLNAIYKRYPSGLPSAFLTYPKPGDAASPLHSTHHKTCDTQLLPPAFLVPCIIDALRLTQHAAQVWLVPAEADVFCARHVAASEDADIILTSDSDLLLYPIGKGRVVLLKDIEDHHYDYMNISEITPAEEPLLASVFAPNSMAERLGLSPQNGLLTVGYLRSMHPSRPEGHIMSQARTPLAGQMEEFLNFCQPYLDPPIADRPCGNVHVNHLDPRLSELVLQLNEADTSPRMYLPMLLENPERRSAWDSCTWIRAIAYSILSMKVENPRDSFQEYRRVQSSQQKGRLVAILKRGEINTAMQGLHDCLHRTTTCSAYERLKEHSDGQMAFGSMQLLLLCIGQGGLHAQAMHLTPFFDEWLLSFDQAQRSDGNGMCTWTVLNLLAHVQAFLYSFRMLEQAMAFHGDAEMLQLSPIAPKVRSILSPVGVFADWPAVADASTLSGQTTRSRVQELLCQLNIQTNLKRTAPIQVRQAQSGMTRKSGRTVQRPKSSSSPVRSRRSQKDHARNRAVFSNLNPDVEA